LYFIVSTLQDSPEFYIEILTVTYANARFKQAIYQSAGRGRKRRAAIALTPYTLAYAATLPMRAGVINVIKVGHRERMSVRIVLQPGAYAVVGLGRRPQIWGQSA
jgi:hypothetical protein